MARITVEDCIDKFPSRFELVLIASNRARKLYSGEKPTVERDNDKNSVIALREIAESKIPIDDMKESLIEEYQTITINDEENENLLNQSTDESQEDEVKEKVERVPGNLSLKARATDLVYKGKPKPRLVAVDPSNGKIKWTKEYQTPIFGAVLTTAGGLIFHGNSFGEVFALDIKDGSKGHFIP